MSSTSGGGGQIRIALDVAVLHDDVAQMMAIVADEAIAPFVEGVAELAGAGDRFVLVEMDRIEAEIHAGEIDDLRPFGVSRRESTLPPRRPLAQ